MQKARSRGKGAPLLVMRVMLVQWTPGMATNRRTLRSWRAHERDLLLQPPAEALPVDLVAMDLVILKQSGMLRRPKHFMVWNRAPTRRTVTWTQERLLLAAAEVARRRPARERRHGEGGALAAVAHPAGSAGGARLASGTRRRLSLTSQTRKAAALTEA